MESRTVKLPRAWADGLRPSVALEEHVDQCRPPYHGYRHLGINFEGDKHRGSCDDYLDMINDRKKDKYHGPKLENVVQNEHIR